ncbi:MAG: C25 family cysteine peptidase [Thermoplasmatota archaeon]
MQRRSSQVLTAIIISALFTFGGYILIFSSAGEPVIFDERELPSGEQLIIDLGQPEFDVDLQNIDGRTWSAIRIESALYPPTSGEPSVPVYSYPLKLRNEVLDIQLERSGRVTLPLSNWLPPSPEVVPLTDEFLSSGGRSKLVPDAAAYELDMTYPEEPLLWSSIGWGWEDGKRYAHYSVSASPFDYNPARNTLTYYTDVRLKVTLGSPEPTQDELSSEPTRSEERAVSRPQQVAPGTELLIITYDPFQDDLAPYVEWNTEKGTIVSMVPISVVNNQYSSLDEPSSIWQYIHDTYFGDDQQLKFVLLAGEVRYVDTRWAWDLDPYQPAGEPDTLSADTYFACLDGGRNNWNTDGDAKWAERGDISDYVPEVYVSRISLDSETEAKNWARKVVKYEKEVPVGNWAGTAGMFGSYTHEYDDGPRQCQYLWNTYLDEVYQTPDRYYSDGTVRSQTGANPLTYSAIQSGFNNGLSIVVYMGHGHFQIWSEGPNDGSNQIIYRVNEAASLSQSPKLPFITAMSCETNWYDNSNFESISEGFTENPNGGAIAYAGAVRTTEGGIGYDQYLPGAPGIQEDFLRMLRNGYRTPGEIFHEAKEFYASYWSNYFSSYEFAYNAYIEHNLLGPPETPLWTSTPKTFNVAYDFDNDHFTNFTVSVTDSQSNIVQDARVTVYSSTLEEMSTSTTDQWGRTKVPFVIPETAFGKITVTKEGFKPYQQEVVLRDLTPPETEPVTGIPNPNGLNGWFTSDPGLSFVCSEPADIHYKWNMGSVYSYPGGTIAIPEGDNILEYWAADRSDNEEDRKSTRIKFDPNTPVAQITLTPDEPDGSSSWYSTQPIITAELEGNGGSPQKIEYWWGRGQRMECNGTIFPPQGESELHIQAVDEAGNKGEQYDLEFRVDSIFPSTTHSTGGNDPNERGWYTTPISITLKCDDRYSYTYYSWDDLEDWQRYSGEIDPLPGNHTLHYYSEDPHGNREDMRSFRVPFDVLPPEIEVTTDPRTPDGNSGWYITRPRIMLEVFNEENHHTIYYQFKNDVVREYLSPIFVQDGTWEITCYAEDEAGNRGLVHELTFKVDTKADDTADYSDLTMNDEGWYTQLPGITLDAGEGADIYYSWEGETGYQRYTGMIYPPADEGQFNLLYYSKDDAGNQETTRSLMVLVDAKPPEPDVDAPSSVDKDQLVTFDLSGTTDGIGVEGYFVDFGDGTDSGWVSSPTVTHQYSATGEFMIKVKARDAAGHESDELVMAIVVNEEGSGMLLLLLAVAGGAVLIVLILVGAAIIVRSRHHHHPPVHHHRPLPHHPRQRLPQGPGPSLPPSQKPKRAPPPRQHPPPLQPAKPRLQPSASIPPPPSPPAIPKPPAPPV